MDPITTAILAAMAAVSSNAIKDSYSALKNLLKKKFGEESDVVEAVKKLEEKPKSEGRKATLQEEIEAVKANEDREIVQLAQSLIENLKEHPEGKQVITQNISHVKYAATSGTGTANISNINEQEILEDDSKD